MCNKCAVVEIVFPRNCKFASFWLLTNHTPSESRWSETFLSRVLKGGAINHMCWPQFGSEFSLEFQKEELSIIVQDHLLWEHPQAWWMKSSPWIKLLPQAYLVGDIWQMKHDWHHHHQSYLEGKEDRLTEHKISRGNFIWCDLLRAKGEGDELTEKVNFIMWRGMRWVLDRTGALKGAHFTSGKIEESKNLFLIHWLL